MIFMRINVQMIDAISIDKRRPSFKAVNCISFGQKEFG
jgi:hypothetical protein